MRFVRVKLPVPWASNLVYSSDGRRLFGLALDGDLWSVRVPSHASEQPDAAQHERSASEGAIVAAGWLEDRLATIALCNANSEIELSHGQYGLNLEPSRPAKTALAGTGLQLAGRGRLEPYARWWQEVDPQAEWFGGVSMIRDDEGKLFAVPIWREGSEEPAQRVDATLHASPFLVADQTTVLAPRDDARAAIIVARARSPHVGERHAIFLLNRQLAGSPGLLCRLDGPPIRAFDGYPGDAFFPRRVLVAVEAPSGVWSFFRVGTSYNGEERLSDVVRASSDDVVGVIGTAQGDPLLVVRDANKTALSLVREGAEIALVSSARSITEVAVSPSAPMLAYLTDVGELGFVWPALDRPAELR